MTERDLNARIDRLAAMAYHKGFCEGTIAISVGWLLLAVLVGVAVWSGRWCW